MPRDAVEPEQDRLVMQRRCVLPATHTAVRRVLTGVSREARFAGLGDGLRSRIDLVLAELLNNVVEHGCAGGRCVIDLHLRATGTAAEIDMRDDGAPLPGQCLLATALPVAEAGDLPEGGFGWPLIHMLGEDLHHSREAGWNRTCLRLREPDFETLPVQ